MKALLASVLVTLTSLVPARAGEHFACNMTAISKSERATYQKLSEKMFAAVLEQKELPNGYAFRMPATSLVDAATWVSFEKKCCPFFTFEIEVARDQGPLWLSVTGSEGVKRFIRSELGLEAR